MFICKFCGKECKSRGPFSQHEKSCTKNPNRVPSAFAGKTHSVETKKKIAQARFSKIPDNLLSVSPRTVSKILKRLGVSCSNCGWDKTSLDLHHIVHQSDNGTDEDSNITALCPNCHRMAHEGSLTVFVSITDQIGDAWREHYYAHARE